MHATKIGYVLTCYYLLTCQCCISYLESLNAKIKHFADKEVTNWINSKLKDRKYHEVLTLTMEEFVEQEQNKKQREQEAEKTQPKRGPEPPQGEEGKNMLHFVYTACKHHAYSVQRTNVCALFQLTRTSASFQMQITSVVEH